MLVKPNIKASTETGLVSLVDTDSFHIIDRETCSIYRCEVGSADYLSKEVQEKASNGKRLDTAPLPTFTVSSDLFALAIHIFALLMNGCNPFTATKISDVESNVTVKAQENIVKGIFPFNTYNKNFQIPAYALKYETLPDYIRKLFDKTFIDGIEDDDFIWGNTNISKRASIEEWIVALQRYSKELKQCTTNANHFYYDKLNYCSWCEMEQRFNSVLTKHIENNIPKQVSFSPKLQSGNRPPINNVSANTNTQFSSTNYSEGHSIFYWIVIAIVAILIISIIASAWEELLYIGGVIIFCILGCLILGS